MLGQMKRQLENSRCFRQGMEKDLEECAEARWLAKPVLDSRALPLDSDNVRLQGPGVMSFEKKHTISGKGSIRLDVPTDGCRRHPSNRAFSVTTMMRLLPGENLERFNRISLWIYVDSPAIANNFMELSIHNQGKQIIIKGLTCVRVQLLVATAATVRKRSNRLTRNPVQGCFICETAAAK